MIDYKHSQGVKYQSEAKKAFITLPVCKYLEGAVWNDIALAAVSTLRPSFIRVIDKTESVTDDARLWRVTVCLNDDETISSIEQEVIADVPQSVPHGHALYLELHWNPVRSA